MANDNTEVLTVRLNEEVSKSATVAADGAERLLDRLKDLDEAEAGSKAARALKQLAEAAKSGGANAAAALQGLRAAAADAEAAAEGALNAWKATGGAVSGVEAVIAKVRAARDVTEQLRKATEDAAAAAERKRQEDQTASLKTYEKEQQDAVERRLKAAKEEQDANLKRYDMMAAAEAAAERKRQEDQAASLKTYEKEQRDAVEKRLKAAKEEQEANLKHHALRAESVERDRKEALRHKKEWGDLLKESRAAEAEESQQNIAKLQSVVAAGAAVAAAIAAAVAVAAVKLLYAGEQLAIKAVSARQGFVDPLGKILKDNAAAERIYSGAVKVAVDLGLDKDETLRRAKALAGEGFRGEQINVILRAQADVSEVLGQERGNAFQKVLEKLKTGNKFQSLDELKEAGIESERVLKKLSDQLGISVDQVKAKLKTGQIAASDGIKAILAAAEEQVGGGAAKGAQAIPRLFTSLKTQIETLFDQVDLSSLKGALDNVKKVLDGPDGKLLKDAVNKLFGTLTKTLFKAFEGPQGEARLKGLVEGTARAMESAAAILEKAGPVIVKVIDAISKAFAKSSGDELLSFNDTFFAVIWELVGFDPSAVVAGLFQMGADIMTGLINGITSGASGVVQALTGAVQSAIDAANSLLGRHSPARATIEMGLDTSRGMAIGLQQGGPMVANAGATMASLVLGGAKGASNDNAVAGAVAPAGAAPAGPVTIQVYVQAGPGVTREQAQAAGDAAGEAAYRAWRRSLARYVREEGRAA